MLYSKERSQEIYSQYLKLIENAPFKTDYIPLYKLKANIENMDWVGDPYLISAKEDKTKLGLDILKRGTFHPMYVSQITQTDNIKDQYTVREGKHRLLSLQLVANCIPEIWNMKIHCFVLDNIHMYQEKEIVPVATRAKLITLPNDENVQEILSHPKKEEFYKQIEHRIEIRGDNCLHFKSYTEWEYLNWLQVFSTLVTRYLDTEEVDLDTPMNEDIKLYSNLCNRETDLTYKKMILVNTSNGKRYLKAKDIC